MIKLDGGGDRANYSDDFDSAASSIDDKTFDITRSISSPRNSGRGFWVCRRVNTWLVIDYFTIYSLIHM